MAGAVDDDLVVHVGAAAGVVGDDRDDLADVWARAAGADVDVAVLLREGVYSTISPWPPPLASSAGSFVSVFEPESRIARSGVGRLTTVARMRSAQSSSGTEPFAMHERSP